MSNSLDQDQNQHSASPDLGPVLIWVQTVCKWLDGERNSNLCMLGNFSCFCCFMLTFFFKTIFSKKSVKTTISVPNSLDLDQHQLSVGPDLDPNCLQRLSADD